MPVLITGANGVVGRPLYARCREMGLPAVPTGRVPRGDAWLIWDMAAGPPKTSERFDCLIHTAPLWLLPPRVPDLAALGVQRLVAFSSTSLLTKERSAEASERQLAASLADSETRLWEVSRRLGLDTTIFRPTMIYGYGLDQNVNAIARFIRRFGFFPVAGRAVGRRQPLSAHDAVEAAISVWECSPTFGETYALSGGETLTYGGMVERIFEALGRPSRILHLPTGLFRALLTFAGLWTGSVTGAMVGRMNEDLLFDAAAAGRDFGFTPEPFLKHPERDLAVR